MRLEVHEECAVGSIHRGHLVSGLREVAVGFEGSEVEDSEAVASLVVT